MLLTSLLFYSQPMILAQQMKSRYTTHLAGKITVKKLKKKKMLPAPFHSQFHSVTNNANNAKAQIPTFFLALSFHPFQPIPSFLHIVQLFSSSSSLAAYSVTCTLWLPFQHQSNPKPPSPNATNMITGMKNVFQKSCVVS